MSEPELEPIAETQVEDVSSSLKKRKGSAISAKRKSSKKASAKRTLVNEAPVPNPFVCDEEINDPIEYAKLALGVILIPIRLIILILTVAIATAAATATTLGQDLSKPLPKGRFRAQQIIIETMYKVLCFCFGIYNLNVIGKRADASECKIMLVASHSTAMDAIVTGAVFGGAAAIAKAEILDTPLGPLFKACQMIMVDREDKNSKATSARKLRERVEANSPWRRQLGLAPEGTCTNRSSLIQFAKGAFEPGVPVQPVALHWDCPTFDPAWTAGAHNRALIVLRCLAQPFQGVTLEFLPVYKPSEEEKNDAILYANNVRNAMAKVLKVPVSEHAYADMFLAKATAKKKLPVGEVLNFTFAALKREVKDTKVGDRLFEVTKSLVGIFGKGASRGLLSRAKYEKKVMTRSAGAVGLDEPLAWDSLFGQNVQSVDFYTFVVAHIRAGF